MSPEVVVAIITSIVSVALVVWNGGRQAGRVQAAIDRLKGIEEKLDKVPELTVKVGTLEQLYERGRSDHKELRATVDRMRERFPSHVED